MAKFISLLVLLMLYGCNNAVRNNDKLVSPDSLAINQRSQPGHLLSGKWAFSKKGSKKKPDASLFVVFKNNNTASLNGPDSEYERIKWRVDERHGLVITGLKKGEDSGWTFRDSLFRYVFSDTNKSLELVGKKQSFFLKRL
jgi:hypothetical protein